MRGGGRAGRHRQRRSARMAAAVMAWPSARNRGESVGAGADRRRDKAHADERIAAQHLVTGVKRHARHAFLQTAVARTISATNDERDPREARTIDPRARASAPKTGRAEEGSANVARSAAPSPSLFPVRARREDLLGGFQNAREVSHCRQPRPDVSAAPPRVSRDRARGPKTGRERGQPMGRIPPGARHRLGGQPQQPSGAD